MDPTEEFCTYATDKRINKSVITKTERQEATTTGENDDKLEKEKKVQEERKTGLINEDDKMNE